MTLLFEIIIFFFKGDNFEISLVRQRTLCQGTAWEGWQKAPQAPGSFTWVFPRVNVLSMREYRWDSQVWALWKLLKTQQGSLSSGSLAYLLAIAFPSPSPSHLQETRSLLTTEINNHQPGFSLVSIFLAIILVICKNTTCGGGRVSPAGVLGSCFSNLNFSHLGTTSAILTHLHITTIIIDILLWIDS